MWLLGVLVKPKLGLLDKLVKYTRAPPRPRAATATAPAPQGPGPWRLGHLGPPGAGARGPGVPPPRGARARVHMDAGPSPRGQK